MPCDIGCQEMPVGGGCSAAKPYRTGATTGSSGVRDVMRGERGEVVGRTEWATGRVLEW